MATQSQSVFDPFKSSKYLVHLGSAFNRASTSPNKQLFTSVRYNYKPHDDQGDKSSTISKVSDADHRYELGLNFEHGGDTESYRYSGSRSESSSSYVLKLDHSKKVAVLDVAEHDYTFNLVSAPDQPNSAALAKEHPHISAKSPDKSAAHTGRIAESEEATDVDELFGDDEPDADNPFDYRHYLSGLPGTSQPTPGTSPAHASQSQTSGSLASQKADAQSSSNAKRKAKPTANGSVPTIKKKKGEGVPRIELERRASTRSTALRPQHETEDSSDVAASHANGSGAGGVDELIIEGEDEDQADQPSGGFGFLGLNTPSHRPTSLQSAANSASPASLLGTPSRSGFDTHATQSGQVNIDDDSDVDALDIGSPSFRSRSGNATHGDRQGGLDEEDEEADFDAVFAALGDGEDEDLEEQEAPPRRRGSMMQRAAEAAESEESEAD